MLTILDIERAILNDEYLNKEAGLMIMPIDDISAFDENIDRYHEDARYIIREKIMDAGFPMILFKKDENWCSLAARHGEETIEELRNAEDIQIFETPEEIVAEVNKYWGPNAWE